MSFALTRGPRNLFSWGTRLDMSPPWTLVNLTVPSTSEIAPDNLLNANILHEDGTPGVIHSVYQTVPLKSGNVYTFSTVAKPINRTWLFLFGFAVETGMVSISTYFDISNGLVGTTVATKNNFIEPVGDGWFRCSMVFQSAYAANKIFTTFVAEANNDHTFDGLDQDSVLIWRPCFNPGYLPEDINSIRTREVPIT